jgi:sialate O-acetylesterase
MYNKEKHFLVIVLLVVWPFLAQAQVTLPSLVSDSMVLQRNEEIRIWGWASPGEAVSLSFQGKWYKVVTGDNKKWTVLLPAMKAGGPYDMVIKASNEVTVRNILVGDVWLCSGQSNMEFPLGRVKDKYAEDVAKSAGYPIREFAVKQRYSFSPVKEEVEGSWKPANPANIGRFSAVGYFLAQSLYDRYKVPIGIIHSSWPGTPAESWISEEGLKPFPHYIKTANQFRDSAYTNTLLRKEKQVSDEWYSKANASDKGMRENDNWKPIRFPGYWEQQGEADIDGVVWARKKITVPASFLGKDLFLELGLIDDIDNTYINGYKIGTNNNKYIPRKYAIPAGLLKEGENTIVIRIIDNGGQGGIAPGKTYRITNGAESIDVSGQWEYQVSTVMPPLPAPTRVFYQPECLYYGMIEPLTWYKIKGAAWYQGEANTSPSKGPEYRRLLPAMIREWRSKWQQGNFPFLIVQLANYMQPKDQPGESGWAMLRESQSVVAATEPNCGLAVAIDIGEANDIHPFDKKNVGIRLALQAARIAYGDQQIVASGPVYSSMEIKDNTIVLAFTNTGSGLVAKGGALRQFAIAGADNKFVWADVVIAGDKIIVQAKGITKPVAVRYAWADNPEGCNLYNKEGLPASPFRTDN